MTASFVLLDFNESAVNGAFGLNNDGGSWRLPGALFHCWWIDAQNISYH